MLEHHSGTGSYCSWSVAVQQPKDFELRWWRGALSESGEVWASALLPITGTRGRAVIVTDQRVNGLYGEQVCRLLERLGISTVVVELRQRDLKSAETLLELVRRFDAIGLARTHDVVVGLGGGAVSDVAMFAASIYRRGVPAVRVPTTLVGLVDAGIGLKTAINFDSAKNRLGSYAPARTTLLFPAFLSTLDERDVRAGFGEILKIALARDEALFGAIEDLTPDLASCANEGNLDTVLRGAIHAMLVELSGNPFEHDLRRPSDLGHTMSPQLEAHRPDVPHGQAVAWDTLLCATSPTSGDT